MLNADYKVIPSTLSGLVNNLDQGTEEPMVEQPQQEYVAPEPSVSDGGGDLPPANFEDPEGGDAPGGGVSKAQGRIVTMVIDRGAATGLAALAKGETEDYRATKDEYSDLEEAVILYMQETNMQMSPLVGLILAVLAIYGLKVPDAIKNRREVEKAERAEQAELIAKRQAQLTQGNNHEPTNPTTDSAAV